MKVRRIAVIWVIVFTFLMDSCVTPQKEGRITDLLLGVSVSGASTVKPYDEITRIIEEESYYSLSNKSKEKLENCFTNYAKKGIPVEELQGRLKENFILARCFPQDRSAEYYSPEGYRLFLADIGGMYGGVGIRMITGSNGAIIKAFIPGSPAEKDGTLRIDDEIRAVGEYGKPLRSVIGESSNQITLRIRGPVGTRVTLNIWRSGQELGNVTLTRSNIDIRLVDHKIYNNKIGYLRIYSFEGDLVDDRISPILKEFRAKGVDRVILDLRNNLGGSVKEAAKLIGLFIKEKNKPFLTLHLKEGNDNRKEFISNGRGEYADWEGVVLVNKNSASASEIVAGALQLEGFRLFGERTYGKGSAQSVNQLSNGGGFKLTIAIYYFANGKSPEGVGLTPDVEINNQSTPMFQDAQLDAAIHYLQGLD
ncbi:MAG: hypothetical protein C4291_04325 [Candidatus Dadabacteria bacterium]